MRLIVTRPAAQAADWVAQLQALGVDACALPLIEIAALEDPAPLHRAWQQLPGSALAMFVSANAVRHFFAAAPAGAVWPDGARAASTGPGTTAALRAAGLSAGQIVEPLPGAAVFDSESLWERLRFEPWSGRRVLVVRGEDGRDWFADTLRARGATVEFVAGYRRCAPALHATARTLLEAALAAPAAHVWHFSSSEAVGHLLGWGRTLQPGADWSVSVAMASHPRIVQTARQAGFSTVGRVGATPQHVADWLARRASLEFERP
jgi:uroporphyrinogen-III synthase